MICNFHVHVLIDFKFYLRNHDTCVSLRRWWNFKKFSYGTHDIFIQIFCNECSNTFVSHCILWGIVPLFGKIYFLWKREICSYQRQILKYSYVMLRVLSVIPSTKQSSDFDNLIKIIHTTIHTLNHVKKRGQFCSDNLFVPEARSYPVPSTTVTGNIDDSGAQWYRRGGDKVGRGVYEAVGAWEAGEWRKWARTFMLTRTLAYSKCVLRRPHR